MGDSRDKLVDRIHELRRRHFGPSGKPEFARRLGLALEEYEAIERGQLPSGDVMVRICEITGEDLQWLLTGVPSRGTVVISGARSRHQTLIARIASALDTNPAYAAPIEAFVELLTSGPNDRGTRTLRRLAPPAEELIPVLESIEELEEIVNMTNALRPAQSTALASTPEYEATQARLAAPSSEYADEDFQQVSFLRARGANGETRLFVHAPAVTLLTPELVGVRPSIDGMTPMFQTGDTLLVAPKTPAALGAAALVKIDSEPQPRCRIWMGEASRVVTLGRVADGEAEQVDLARVRWSLEILYRIAAA